jgi:hypothetical protein
MAAKKEIPKELLRKQLFAALYVGACKLNGVEAARQAGYTGSNGVLAVRASKLLRDEAVRKRLADHAATVDISQREVLARLAAHSRGTMEDFISFDGDEDPHLDLIKARHAKQLGLLKKFKEKRQTIEIPGKKGDNEMVSETVTYEIELYDAQAATVQLGRLLGMYVEQYRKVDEMPQGDMSDEDWLEFYTKYHVPEAQWLPGVRRLRPKLVANKVLNEGGT